MAGSLFASSFLQESPAAGNPVCPCACRAGAGGPSQRRAVPTAAAAFGTGEEAA